MPNACATPIGIDVPFGVPNEEDGLLTESVSVVHRSDKKEIRNGCGTIVTVIRYNKTAEVTIKMQGLTSLSVGDALTLANATETALARTGGKLTVDEITIDLTNEDVVKSSVNATQYSGIAA